MPPPPTPRSPCSCTAAPTAANSGSGTDTVTETAGDGTLQASLLHDAGEWYADAVNFLIRQGRLADDQRNRHLTSVADFTSRRRAIGMPMTPPPGINPGIGDEMSLEQPPLSPPSPARTVRSTITGQAGETVYYTTGDGDPIANAKYTKPPLPFPR